MTNEEILTKAIEKAIKGYETTQVGRVWNRKTGIEVKGSINHKGYRYITIYLPEFKKSKKVLVHRLVALNHIPNPDNLPHINHKDGNRLNNEVWNLEWCTAAYNVSDGFKRGRIIWNKDNMSKERILYLAERYPRQIFWYLTANNFAAAKCLWGKKEVHHYDIVDLDNGGTTTVVTKPIWHYRLQQMVVADDALVYLKENI